MLLLTITVQLGRSGSGKTTVLLARMATQYLAYWSSGRDGWRSAVQLRSSPMLLLEAEREARQRRRRHRHQQQQLSPGAGATGAIPTITEADEEAADEEGEGRLGDGDAADERTRKPVSSSGHSSNGGGHQHQLFVTRTNVLRREVLKQFRALQRAGAAEFMLRQQSQSVLLQPKNAHEEFPFPVSADDPVSGELQFFAWCAVLH